MWLVLPPSLDQLTGLRVLFDHSRAGIGVLEEPSARATIEAWHPKSQRGERQNDDFTDCLSQCFGHVQLEEIAVFTRTCLAHRKLNARAFL